jgi:glucuronoarabinoxylan endo-1,4-beta-xylanase
MNANQIHDLVAAVGATFTSRNLFAAMPMSIIMPESARRSNLSVLGDTTLNDANTSKYVGVGATHLYWYDAGNVLPYTTAVNQGKEVWVTEMCDVDDKVNETTMASAITVHGYMHNSMVNMNCNAFHFWWIKGGGGDGGAAQQRRDRHQTPLCDGELQQVHPSGYKRIGATANPQTNVYVSAYNNTALGNSSWSPPITGRRPCPSPST